MTPESFCKASGIAKDRITELCRSGELTDLEAMLIMTHLSRLPRNRRLDELIGEFETAVDSVMPSIWLVWPQNLI